MSKYTIERYPQKAGWYVLKEGEIVRAAGSLEHCEGWKRRLDYRDEAQQTKLDCLGVS